MNRYKAQSRRRFLQIAGLAGLGAAGMTPLASWIGGRQTPPAWEWRGIVLGADAAISLYGLPEDKAARLTRDCFQQLRRLEQLFSIYDANSAVRRLNRQGYLDQPPSEFIQLLEQSRQFSEHTRGLFDITIQPLWECFRDHYAQTQDAPPSDAVIRDALSKVDYRKVRLSRDRVRFAQPGMAVTFNGIAQGWITDRIVDFLREEGVTSTLVNLGEYRALGSHPEHRPWHLGVRGAGDPNDLLDVLSLQNAALAVSGGHGHRFASESHPHHLLHPQTAKSQPVNRTIAIVAPTAAEADALSTACAVVDDATAHSLVRGSSATLRIY